MNLFRRELLESRRGLIGWAVGLAVAVLIYMPLYPSVGGTDLIETYVEMFPPELSTLFGIDMMATGPGYTQVSYFGLMAFVLLAIAAIVWGSRSIAGAEESGTLELTLAHGVTRWQVVIEAALALLVRVAIPTAVGSMLILALNASAQLGIDPVDLLAVTVALFLLTSLIGAAALFGGAVTGRMSVATGLGALIAVGAYVSDAVADIADLPWLARLSPFDWAYGQDPITTGFDLGGLLLLLLGTVLLVVLGGVRFAGRDVGA